MTVGDIDIEGVLLTNTAEHKNVNTPFLQDHPFVVKPEDDNSASLISGVFNLSNTVVGSGIMSLPFAIKILGVVPGVLLIVVSGSLTKFSIDILLRFSDHGRANSYAQLMNGSFGRTGEILLQMSIVSSGIGGGIIYMIIIADVISGSNSGGLHHSGVLEEWFGKQWWTNRVFVLISMTVFILIPSAWRKRMDSLRHTSAVAIGSAAIFLGIVFGLTTYKLAIGAIKPPALFPSIDSLSSFWNLITAIPVLIFAYLCHFNVHIIQSELKDPSQMTVVVKSSLAVCGLIYVMAGLFGFLLFGDLTASDVLSNFDSDLGIPYSSLVSTMVRLSYAVHILLVFPVNFYAFRMNFDGLVVNSATPLSSDKWRFAVTTLGLLLVILLGAIFIPDIWVAFQFVCGPAGALISFIFPASVVLRDYPRIATKSDKIRASGLIVVAVFSTLVAMYSNIVALL